MARRLLRCSMPLLRRSVLLFVALAAGVLRADERRVIVDQDAYDGVNLHSILMLLQAPGVRVLGITVESGDGWQKESVAQTLRMLELIGRTEVPVAAGATFPLVNSQEETKRWEALYGKLPYKGAWMESWPDYNTVNRPHSHGPDVIPPLRQGMPTTRPIAESADTFLVRQVHAAPGQVTIMALGPFTNLALAVQHDPGFAGAARELVLMGGSFNPDCTVLDEFARQLINNPRVEFNNRWDPEAARIVLHAGWKRIVIVPTDPTVGTKLTNALAARAAAGGTPAAQYFDRFGDRGYPMWDETAVGIWLDPGMIREQASLFVDVDISHTANYGGTLSWSPGFNPGLGEPRATVIRRIDIPRLQELFVTLLSERAAR